MKIDVKKVAKLANLNIKPQLEAKFENQINEILAYFEKLKNVNTNDIEITSQVTGLENVSRKDSPTLSLTQEDAISGTKSKHNGLFKVKAIFEE